MLSSLFTGVSGLNANMTALSVIGNNIANVNTIGFKASRISFSDVLSASLTGVSGQAQIGLGVNMSSVAPLFSQGGFETTSSGLDLAISGDGFFVVRDDTGANFYSRAGQFNLNKDGFITNPEGRILRGFQADNAGNLQSSVDDIQISSAAIPANPSANINVIANLDSSSDISGFVFDATNDAVVFNEGAGNLTISLTTDGGLQTGRPYTGTEVAVALKTALEAVNTTGDTYTVDYDSSTGSFNITNETGNANPLNILWTDAGSTATSIMGFTADDAIVVGTSAASDVAGGAFDVNNASLTSNFSTTVTVFDSLGNSHAVNIYFRKDSLSATGNSWEWFGVVDGSDSTSGLTEVQAQGTFGFNTSGALSLESSITYPTGGFDFAGGATQDQTIALDFGDTIAEGGTGIEGVTQYGASSAVFNQNQDGYAAGTLQNMSIADDGLITGIFSNGRTRVMGQIALAKFPDASSLSLVGDNLFSESTNSGQPLVGTPGSAGRGSLHTNALELSTVDIAAEFVKMIAAQRGFQVNSKVITTSDEVLNELVNLKR